LNARYANIVTRNFLSKKLRSVLQVSYLRAQCRPIIILAQPHVRQVLGELV
jgi:hypothetical protein